ncbi:MAG: prephenate dehydrogenase/arogenate dehydrogenase family protein [Actinobacteria bacterium]|uniref:Prephenate dehydrogenase n=1 Tax=freshwater metagenome TaxID=449393 RepID=A0A6J6GUC5_9ZZZZ|nr:prephenate dehydrogenase/arogenate dehydrogenase family protein [Actinomycetota bacterium]
MISKVKIIGSGLIGTSIGLALKSAKIKLEMVDLDPNSAKLANDLVGGVNLTEPEVVIVSAPISNNLELILESLKLYPEAIVIDIASVKSNLSLKVAELSANTQNFISSHPMAGREVSGTQSARADLFSGRAWIGIKSANSSERSTKLLAEIVEICGATLYWVEEVDHDKLVAAISHLPQVLSTTLANLVGNLDGRSLNLSGQGLRDMLRLSSSNGQLWSQLMIANKSSLSSEIDKFLELLTKFNDAIKSENYKEIETFFNAGNLANEKIPGKHGLKIRKYSYLPIVIMDEPGQLAKIFNECAQINVNIEDLSIEHSPGQQTGLITLALNQNDAERLFIHLKSTGWNVHEVKVDK